MSKNKSPWGGRFKKKTDPLMIAFGESLSFDKRLAEVDVRGSMAHAKMLARQNIIAKADAAKIVDGLKAVLGEIRSGKFPYRSDLEDIHMNVEARLVEKIGDVGKKLHTGRSRNDQVALDMRLWVREETDRIVDRILELEKSLVGQARKNIDVIMPGYTHMQRAQPVSMAHHLMAYVEMLERDRDRFEDASVRADVMPLGAGAIAGSTLPLNPRIVARELGFLDIQSNSMDAVSDRDFIVEFVFCCALCQVHLSRLAEELVLWSGDEFGFIDMPEEFSTGSSLMPQKKNPDAAELTRGKTGRVVGDLMSLLTLMKGLPLTYNRDMQEDKESLFDAADTLGMCLAVMASVVKGMKVKPAACKNALASDYLLATDIAEYLVRKGMPFREAHEVVGKLVGLAVEKGCRLSDLSMDEYRSLSEMLGKDVKGLLDPAKSVEARKTPGGPARHNVLDAILKREATIKALRLNNKRK